jgi:hypothetical protein
LQWEYTPHPPQNNQIVYHQLGYFSNIRFLSHTPKNFFGIPCREKSGNLEQITVNKTSRKLSKGIMGPIFQCFILIIVFSHCQTNHFMLCIGEIQVLSPTRNPKKVSCDSLWSSIQGIIHWIVHGTTWANPTVHCQHLVIFQKFLENQFDTHYLIIFILNQKCKKILHIQQWWKSSISKHVHQHVFISRLGSTEIQKHKEACNCPVIASFQKLHTWLNEQIDSKLPHNLLFERVVFPFSHSQI